MGFSVYSTAPALQNHSSRLHQAANRTANQTGDLADNMIDTLKSEKGFKAASKVTQTADEMLGTVIDLMA